MSRTQSHGVWLRGVEVLTATEAGLLSTNDEEIVEYAYQNKLIIFTQDDDFHRLAASGVSHAGIVYSKQDRHTLGDIVRHLRLIASCLEPSDMTGSIEYY